MQKRPRFLGARPLFSDNRFTRMISGNLKNLYGQNNRNNSFDCYIARSRDILLSYVSLEYGFLAPYFDKYMDGYSVIPVNFSGYPPFCVALFPGELIDCSYL